jgi:transcriptional regulator with XRE-family HTH domain
MKRQYSNGRAMDDNDYYDEYLKALGKRIKKLRKQRGFTLREMGVIYGHGDSHWRRLERFGAGNMASLINVAKALEISLSTLLAGVEQAARQEDRRKEGG